jgi:hypothetical protein
MIGKMFDATNASLCDNRRPMTRRRHAMRADNIWTHSRVDDHEIHAAVARAGEDRDQAARLGGQAQQCCATQDRKTG